MGIVPRKYGYQWPGVHQHTFHFSFLVYFSFPKPSKYRRLVLRSFGRPLTHPISPAASAASKADAPPVPASRYVSRATRTMSDGVFPLALERPCSRLPRFFGTRIVMRSEAIFNLICLTFYYICQTGLTLTLSEVNRAISGADGQRASATIELAAYLARAHRTRGSHRHVQIDVAIVGMQIDIGRQIARHFQGDVAIARLKPSSLSDGWSLETADVNVSL